MHSICWLCCLSMDDEEEDEEENEVLLLLVAVVVAAEALDWLGGGAAATAAVGSSREVAGVTGFLCPVRSPDNDRGPTWDTGEERVPCVSPTPSAFLQATIAMSSFSRSLRAQLFRDLNFYRRAHVRKLRGKRVSIWPKK